MKKFKRLAVIMGVLISLFMISSVFAMAEEADDFILLTDSPDNLIFDYDQDYEDALSDGLDEDVLEPEFDGYRVLINYEYISFTDAEPENINGRIMVPFRAILESLNAEVQWNNSTKTVTAIMDDTTISFKVGGSKIDILKGDEKSVKSMDVVPYINAKNDRTYVSTRFVAESLGYNVGWDSESRTVVIIDKNSILEGIDSEFTIINDLLKNSRQKEDIVYEETMKATLGFVVKKEILNLLSGSEVMSKDIDFRAVVDGSSLTKNSEMSLDASIKMNMDELLSLFSIDNDISSKDTAILKALNDLTVKASSDMKTGDIYFTTNINNLLSDNANENTWFKINLYDFFEGTGIDFKGLIEKANSGEISSMHDILDIVFDSVMSVDMSEITYDELNNTYDAIKAIASDKAIKVKKSKNETTYTMNLANLNKTSIGYFGSNMKGKIVIKQKDGVYTCSANLAMLMEGFMSISFNIDTTRSESDASVEKMPSGAEVVDLTPLVQVVSEGMI